MNMNNTKLRISLVQVLEALGSPQLHQQLAEHSDNCWLGEDLGAELLQFLVKVILLPWWRWSVKGVRPRRLKLQRCAGIARFSRMP